jgi:hypothetical protein
MGSIPEEQLQSLYDAHEHRMQRDYKFDELIQKGCRIMSLRRQLFTGVPYSSSLKPNKEKTYELLGALLDENINEVCELF